ncbi:MAG TPA: MFS transporter [Quisquiliibacterium sp.]|nr:MFS transporter [Quisquiliibacterium sp.]HQP66853.1 MFS transporter [Quisquiliibacterium sp.]
MSATALRAGMDPQRILVWMCVIIGVNQLGFGALVPVLPLYAQSFGVSTSAIGMTIAIYGLARFAAAMPGAGLSDRFGRRPTIAFGGVLSTLGNLWSAFAPGYDEFLVARFVAGAGAGLVMTAGSVVVADISPPERRGRYMATYMGVFLFAVGIGPFPGGVLAEHFGLAAPFHVYAALALVVGAVAWWIIPETRDFGRNAHGHGGPPRAAFLQQLRTLSRNRGFMLVCLIGFMNAFVRTGGLFSIVPLLASKTLGLSPGQIGSAFALGSVLGMLAAYPAGALADRYGRKPIIVPATLLTGISFVAYWLAPSFAWFLVASVVWGVAAAISGAAPSAYAADSASPGTNATAMASYRMLSDVGYVVGPISLGLLADAAGAGVTLSVSAALIVLVGVLFARYAPESHRR